MNNRSLIDRIKNLSAKTNVQHHLLLSNYFFETIIKRIDRSKYKNILAIHGGYLLGLFFGIKSRSTKDIDISLISKKAKNKNLLFVRSFIKKILDIDLKDGIHYEINGNIEKFKTDRISGYRIKLIGYKSTLRQHFSIDLTIDYLPQSKLRTDKFDSIIENEQLHVLHPIFEKIIADKLHAIVHRSGQTSRIRDFYDLYILSKNKNFNVSELNYFINKLFMNSINLDKWRKIFTNVKTSELHNKLWKNFQNNNFYAKDIDFHCVIDCILELITKIE